MINKKKEIQYFLLLQIGQKLIVENKSCFVAKIIDHNIRLKSKKRIKLEITDFSATVWW